MFFPLHDQNNEPVKIVPIITYVIIGLCFLVQLHQMSLDFSQTDKIRSAHFVHRHGMVPKAFFEGNPTYQIGPESLHLSSKDMAEAEEIPVGSSEREMYDLLVLHSSKLSLWLMPLTCLFMHAGLMHLLTNIWFFWIFSDNVEERFGSALYAIFYLAAGVFSSLAHAYLNSASFTPLVGASGAVSAVMGAYIVLFPKHRITSYFCPAWFFIRRLDVPAVLVLGLYLALNILSMAKTGTANVAFDAHIGGFVAGFVFAHIHKTLVNVVPGNNK
ncbi:MAG: rhomboid family intramembrane serine protease [Candidatus Riflebacteria bacterium]|nr:rhomboid family intramembrane serine protease [Candidatus Riflebacteria bacterium]